MNRKLIETLQVISLSFIWMLFTGIAIWIVTLIRESLRLHDAPDASVGISIVAIPVFFTLASVLTYVFIGLRRGRKEESER
jgi:flagellar biosynthesis protein FliP